MFQIILVSNNTSANVLLSYRTFSAADVALKNIYERMKDGLGITQADDFGNSVHIGSQNISYALFNDIVKSQSLMVERELVIARAGASIQEQYKNDPEAVTLLNGRMKQQMRPN